MVAIFRPSANVAATVTLLGMTALFVGGIGWWWMWPRTDYVRHVRWTIDQPVPFSHEHHVSGLGIDCRFAIPALKPRPAPACRRPRPA